MKGKAISILVFGCLLSWANLSVSHEISAEKEKQLKAVFSEAAKFSEEHLTLTDSQIKQIEKLLRSKLNPKYKKVTIFIAESNKKGKPLGYINFFEAKEPDGDIVPAAVGVKPDGTIQKVVIFTHHADDNPVAGEGFLGPFTGKKINEEHLWHSDHTIKPIKGHESASSSAHKAIQRTCTIIGVVKGILNSKQTMSTTEKEPKVMYQCPMKDSPPQNNPGKCPQCGMNLEKIE
jgi:Na+-translocating ferredoxin:NAD+ oxidoreductase RnfG subunit